MDHDDITDSKDLHKNYATYGASSEYSNPQSHKYLLTIPRAVQACQEVETSIASLLDHGTGNGGLPSILNAALPTLKVAGYDPAVKIFSQTINQKYDIVTSIDVLEHISKSEIQKTLDEIHDATNKFFFFCIDLIPAIKQTSDGRNAHFLIAPSDWWTAQLKNKFNIVTTIEVGELESGTKYPLRLFGCATDSMKHFKTMNTFLENVGIAQKRWVWTSTGVILKEY